jgi:hypothetical protein
MWNLNSDIPSFESVQTNMTQHFIEFTNFVDLVLEERVSKLNLLIIPVVLLLTKNYVLPFLFNVVFKMNITTIGFKVAMSIPLINFFVEKILRNKVETMLYQSLNEMLFVSRKEVYEQLPVEPIKVKHLEEKIDHIHQKQLEAYGTNLHSGTIYHSEDKYLNEAIEHSMQTFANSNSYDPESYKGIAHMQADIVNCTMKLFHGDADTHGMLTSGGTESILS